MSPPRIGLALLAAFVFETLVGLLAPGAARVLDPFLLVVVYAGLTRGELQGMLVGASAGWILDVFFGARILGIVPLGRLLVGFAVGAAGARLLLVSPLARLLVLATATFADARIFLWLAAVFEVPVLEPGWRELLLRASVNAVLGAALFELVDRRLRREARA